jgi:hypothetical protein
LVPDTRVVEAIDFDSEDAAFAGTMTMTWALAPIEGGHGGPSHGQGRAPQFGFG